jgi:hypothetical protein
MLLSKKGKMTWEYLIALILVLVIVIIALLMLTSMKTFIMEKLSQVGENILDIFKA